MQTKLGAFAARLSEAGWLAALIIVPILFNIYTERVFEEDKIPLLRSIAVVMLVALLVVGVERGRALFQVGGQPLWRVPLVLPALALVAAYLLATIFSVVPRISFWGAYIRRQGTYSFLSYVVIFLAIILLMRSRRQVERLVTIILVTSAPASLYGILQHFGRDPLPWGGDVTIRVSSVAGNPIFIAAYLIMIVPLTLVRVIENFGRLMEEPPEGESDRAYLAPSLLAGAYLFLLIIQLLVVFPYAQSRGPWLGMGAGLAFFGVVFALRRRLRWLTLSVAGAAVVGMLFLVVLNVPNSPLAPLRSIRYVDRLGSVLELETGTGKVRALIWEGVLDLLAANPVRNLVGYGPEAMYVAYNPHYPPDLAHYESRNASPDRSHNETFDSLVMTGVFGFAAQLVLFGSFFYFVLRWLGMINSGAQRNTFVALAGIGAVVGVLLPRILQGSFILSGVGLAAGMTTGLVIYLLAYAVTHLNQSGTPERPYSLLLIGLLSAVMAHFVEVHFGIAIGATRLYFWTYLALAVVVGIPLLQTEQAPVPAPAAAGTGAQRARRERRRAAERRAAFTPPAVATGTLLATSLMAGLLLIVMVFNYVSPSFSLSAKGYALVWLFVGVWAFGALAVVTQSAFESADQTRWLRRLAIYTGVTLSVVLLFVILYVPWVNWQPTTTQITEVDLRNIAAHLANNVAFVYVFTFLTMIATALALLREEPVPVAFARQPGWQAVGYAVLALATIPIIVATNLNIARADISNKQAAAYEASRDWDPAIILYQEALQLQPNEDRYFLNLGRAYMEKARTLQDQPEQRDLYLQQALDVLQRARETNPLNTDHTRNLASLHRVWATLVDSDQERERLLDRADQYYAEAVTLSPHNAALWNDWAALHLDRGQYDQAREKLEQSLALDQQYPDTYMLLGSTYLEQEEWEKAVEAYDQALAIDPRAIQAYSGKAFAHSRLGQTEEAIAANQAAIEVAPNDFISHRNLALLYQQTGQLELALQEAEIALSLAGENDRPAIESFIAQIRQEMATAGG